MNLRRKNIAITALAAALMTSSIMATANAQNSEEPGTSSATFTISKSDKEDKAGIKTEKTTMSGSSATFTLNSNIPAHDRVEVYIKNENHNIVSATGHWQNVTKGKREYLTYLEGKGKQGNMFYPCFSLNQSSQSSSLTVSYTFKP